MAPGPQLARRADALRALLRGRVALGRRRALRRRGAAHASLSPRLKALLDGATNVTVLAKGYQNLDVRDPKYAEVLATHRPVAQPVVAVDALTGDTWLNVNAAYSVSIPEMGAAESAALLPMLCAHVAKPDHCVRVHYEPGDVVIFDNHRLQHYAVSDYWPEPRRVLRMSFAPTRIAAAVAPERDRPAAAAGPRAVRTGAQLKCHDDSTKCGCSGNPEK